MDSLIKDLVEDQTEAAKAKLETILDQKKAEVLAIAQKEITSKVFKTGE